MERWVTTYIRPDIKEQLLTPKSLYGSTSCTAIRAWGDALISIRAGTCQPRLSPPAEIRPYAVFAWPQRIDDPTQPHGSLPVEVLVEPSKCAVARKDLIDPVFSWQSWQQLAEYLVEHGETIEYIEEAISPATFDEAFMRVDKNGVINYVRTLKSSLMNEMLEYFARFIEGYLASWTTLSEWDDHDHELGQWEIIVPEEAALQISL